MSKWFAVVASTDTDDIDLVAVVAENNNNKTGMKKKMMMVKMQVGRNKLNN